MKKIKKRGAVYGVVALLLCTAAYLNWSYVEPPADLLQTDGSSADSASAASDDGAAAGEDYFASSRLTREKARDEAVSTLPELSESADADETAQEAAVKPPISNRNRWAPAMSAVIIPTSGPPMIPAVRTPMTRVLTMAPPVFVPV